LQHREAILFNIQLPSEQQLIKHAYPPFDQSHTCALINEIIQNKTVDLTYSDILHSDPENYLHFSPLFQAQILQTLQQFNKEEYHKLDQFLQQKVQQQSHSSTIQPHPTINVRRLELRARNNVKITEAGLRAAQLDSQLTHAPALNDRESDWLPASALKHFSLMPIDDYPEPVQIPIKKKKKPAKQTCGTPKVLPLSQTLLF
jgi:hypothetical protein